MANNYTFCSRASDEEICSLEKAGAGGTKLIAKVCRGN